MNNNIISRTHPGAGGWGGRGMQWSRGRPRAALRVGRPACSATGPCPNPPSGPPMIRAGLNSSLEPLHSQKGCGFQRDHCDSLSDRGQKKAQSRHCAGLEPSGKCTIWLALRSQHHWSDESLDVLISIGSGDERTDGHLELRCPGRARLWRRAKRQQGRKRS